VRQIPESEHCTANRELRSSGEQSVGQKIDSGHTRTHSDEQAWDVDVD
jgi:hypothetical protein